MHGSAPVGGLTLPSRGTSNGYRPWPPLMSNVEPQMFGFWRQRKFEDSQLGQFTRVRTMWIPAAVQTGLGVSMEGGKERPSPEVVEVARRLLRDPKGLIQEAEAFVRSDARAAEFIAGNGELVCDGFTVYRSGKFAVEFSLTDWADAMISVPFEGTKPCAISLGD